MGGLGTRLMSHTEDIPKSLMDVHGKPFFYYQLILMKLNGFKNFLFCLGHKAEEIKKYFGNGTRFGVQIKYSYDGKKLLGTAAALKKALAN